MPRNSFSTISHDSRPAADCLRELVEVEDARGTRRLQPIAARRPASLSIILRTRWLPAIVHDAARRRQP
ncbi:hypothetical protein [Variovorax sp. SRS16]|uniref:hypothetical protein n=1 Tax=Variovorax sp. SRS16 TaxID=282217 RepID=UPI0013A55B48|nr:hypothetical protein [Variovorax sp. SRS16]